jgi:hypothetical protein
VDALVEALKELQHEEISHLVVTLTKMTQDGGRNGLPRVVSTSAPGNDGIANISPNL